MAGSISGAMVLNWWLGAPLEIKESSSVTRAVLLGRCSVGTSPGEDLVASGGTVSNMSKHLKN